MIKKEIKNTKNTNEEIVLFSEEIGAAIKRFLEVDEANRCVVFCAGDEKRNAIATVGEMTQILDSVARILMHIHKFEGVDWTTLRLAMIGAIDFFEKNEKEIAPPIKIPVTNTKPS